MQVTSDKKHISFIQHLPKLNCSRVIKLWIIHQFWKQFARCCSHLPWTYWKCENISIFYQILLEIFVKVENIASNIGIEILIPRQVTLQIHRSNVPASSAMQYYEWSICIPYLDSLLSSLRCRFSEDNLVFFNLFKILPTNVAYWLWWIPGSNFVSARNV